MTKSELRWGEQTIPRPEGQPDWGNPEYMKKTNEAYNSHVYEQMCPTCETVNRCYTQQDESPEYYSDVYLECRQCLEKVLFKLPVN